MIRDLKEFPWAAINIFDPENDLWQISLLKYGRTLSAVFFKLSPSGGGTS